MRKAIYIFSALAFIYACNNDGEQTKNEDINTTRTLEKEELVKRGEYLVTISGCGEQRKNTKTPFE